METLNDALRRHFPGAYPVDISGGFFAPLTLAGIAGDREAAFIQSAKAAGVGIAAAWQAIAPDAREAQREKGLFIRLTFPAFRPDQLDWGLAKLKETAARFA
ncbi:MAG TPA: hypothetical protein VLT88_13425 [Desulfosarcina sp.]|nr:hypothetical protein [Desulfosarcina sp.]